MFDSSTCRLKYISTAEPLTVAHVRFSIVLRKRASLMPLNFVFGRSNTRKAAKLAVYDATMTTNTKNRYKCWTIETKERKKKISFRTYSSQSPPKPYQALELKSFAVFPLQCRYSIALPTQTCVQRAVVVATIEQHLWNCDFNQSIQIEHQISSIYPTKCLGLICQLR